ncbi:MAG: hypothetical protein CM15mV5_0760 [uncultured marine virus]|nr:MAG: hypothetical protein CM15mV5_0760 [uncultured marine virus]
MDLEEWMKHLDYKDLISKTLNIMENFDQGFYSGEIDFFDITDCEVDTYRYNIKDNYAKWEKVAAQKDLPVLYKEALSDVSTRTMTVAYTKDLFLGSDEDNTNDKLMFLETVGQALVDLVFLLVKY